MSDADTKLAEIRKRTESLPSLADKAAAITLAHFRSAIEVADKSSAAAGERFDPVTIADREAEQAIRDGISAAFPSDSIVGEELGTRDGSSGFHWVIDPIDGTRAYVCGAPTWGTLIAVLDNARAVAGLMEQPFTRERYVGAQGTSWFSHAGGEPKRLKTSAKTQLSEAYLSTTAPELFSVDRGELAAFNSVKAASQQVRYGLDCYAYCLLAAGTLDIVVEAGLNSYDIAALIPIVEGAGGIVTTWSGAHPENGGQIIASANADLHEQALDILRSTAVA